MFGVSIEPWLTPGALTYNLVDLVCANTSSRPLLQSYASANYVVNPSLGSVQYGSFFKLCRMQAVSFNLETTSGLLFQLFDSLSCGVIGMLAVASDVGAALDSLATGFNFIRSNIGNANSYSAVSLSGTTGGGDDDGGDDGVNEHLEFVKMGKTVEKEAKRVKMLISKITRAKLAKLAAA